MTAEPNLARTSRETAATVAPGPKRNATRGVRSPRPNGPSIAASSTKTALWVKDGPAPVPEVNPTTVNRSGPVAVINWICWPISIGPVRPRVNAVLSPLSIATSEVLPGSGRRPATTETLRRAALESWRPTRVTLSP